MSVSKGVREIRQEDWDACANHPGRPYNPFLAYAFWLALEESGSASPRKGWASCHLVLKDGNGAIAAIMPCYLKSH
ncbi:MAG: peptidogalycan biosysnthesis protein, partial [Rhodomicrobium sp.]